ncbi:hypothetical protein ACFOSD_04785 [Salinispirillum marinum]|uniref:Lipoprotein n=2 Tax=Saccharospirillaceae TaxID=255527 RepID=A0ABV8BE55_9GAMM
MKIYIINFLVILFCTGCASKHIDIELEHFGLAKLDESNDFYFYFIVSTTDPIEGICQRYNPHSGCSHINSVGFSIYDDERLIFPGISRYSRLINGDLIDLYGIVSKNMSQAIFTHDWESPPYQYIMYLYSFKNAIVTRSSTGTRELHFNLLEDEFTQFRLQISMRCNGYTYCLKTNTIAIPAEAIRNAEFDAILRSDNGGLPYTRFDLMDSY